MISIKHGSRVWRRDGNRVDVVIVYQGTYGDLYAYSSEFAVGQSIANFGRVERVTLSQGDGVIWELQIECTTEPATWPSSNDDPEDPEEPERPTSFKATQQLTTRTLSVPIEANPNYQTRWNHYLLGACYFEGNNYTNATPSWWGTATTPYLDPLGDGKNYKWVKSLSETPQPTKYVTWSVVNGCQPTKPGITSFDSALYVITDTEEYWSKTNAGNAAGAINDIVGVPRLGDFGLTPAGYNWKIDGVSVTEAESGRWRTTTTYTRSGDANGWDRDIYP